MADATIELLKTQLRQLRLPTMGREFEKLARDAAAGNQTFSQFLLRLTELELATRATNAVASRIKDAGFPVEKDFDTYDFSALPPFSARPVALMMVAADVSAGGIMPAVGALVVPVLLEVPVVLAIVVVLPVVAELVPELRAAWAARAAWWWRPA